MGWFQSCDEIYLFNLISYALTYFYLIYYWVSVSFTVTLCCAEPERVFTEFLPSEF